jgi:predicted cobalt transporter CbtA
MVVRPEVVESEGFETAGPGHSLGHGSVGSMRTPIRTGARYRVVLRPEDDEDALAYQAGKRSGTATGGAGVLVGSEALRGTWHFVQKRSWPTVGPQKW